MLQQHQTATTYRSVASPRTVIELPSSDVNDNEVLEILASGNIPLLIGDSILAEISVSELQEGLLTTGSLNRAELAAISADLVENITYALNNEDEECDMAEVAADAAALFVLCMRRYNVLDVDNLPACSVSFSQERNDVQMKLAG